MKVKKVILLFYFTEKYLAKSLPSVELLKAKALYDEQMNDCISGS